MSESEYCKNQIIKNQIINLISETSDERCLRFIYVFLKELKEKAGK